MGGGLVPPPGVEMTTMRALKLFNRHNRNFRCRFNML